MVIGTGYTGSCKSNYHTTASHGNGILAYILYIYIVDVVGWSAIGAVVYQRCVFESHQRKNKDIFSSNLILMRLGPVVAWSYDSWIYNYLCNQYLSLLMLWVGISIRAINTTLCDNICQWLATSRWFPLGPPVSSINKIDRHYITQILLKVAFNFQTHRPTSLSQLSNGLKEIRVIVSIVVDKI